MWKFMSQPKFDDQAKAFCSFPVMVAAVAFCIGCIMAVFQITLAKNSRHKAANKLTHSARWRTALSDLRDPESLHTESPPDSDVSTNLVCEFVIPFSFIKFTASASIASWDNVSNESRYIPYNRNRFQPLDCEDL